MSIVFNLKKSFQQIKQAMAHVYENKPYEWFRIDQIEENDPEWTKWITGGGTYTDAQGVVRKTKSNKSLINAVASARNAYYAKKLLFRARYGVSDEQVNTFYKFFIGYSPFKGMRSCGVGPYTAKSEAWSFAKKKMQESGISLQSPTILEDLLKLSENLPLPELPPELNPEDKGNAKDPLVKNYKLQVRHKRELLEVRADLMNKFAPFEKTYNKIDRAEMDKGINIYLQKIIKEFGPLFDESDVGIVIKSFDPDKKNVGKVDENAKWINTEFESIDPNNPEGKKLMDSGIMPGVGTFLKLNSKGINKLFQKYAKDGGWTDLYEHAMEAIAQVNGKTVEETKSLVATDRNFSQMFLTQLDNIRAELIKKKDPRAALLSVTSKTNIKDPPKMGAQIPQTYRISKAQRSILDLKVELLKAIVQVDSDDPEKVAQTIKANRKARKTKATGELNAEFIPAWLNAIKSEDEQIQKMKKQKKVRPYADILKTALNDLDSINKSEELRDAGAFDLATAFRFLSTTHMKSEVEFIDSQTHAKLQLVDAPNMFAKPGEEDLPVTSKDLTELRIARENKMPEEQLQKQIKEEILKEIGDTTLITGDGIQENILLDPEEDKGKEEEIKEQKAQAPLAPAEGKIEVPAKPGELDFGVTEVPQVPQEKVDAIETPATPATPETTVPSGEEAVVPSTPVTSEMPEMPQEKGETSPTPPLIPKKKKKKLNFKSLMGSTFQSLIIMARDLDSQGKEESAEEIHKIIRKYQNKG